MMLPLLIVAISVGALVIVAKRPPSTMTGGYLHDSSHPHLDWLRNCIRSGQKPSKWLVSEAVREAYEMGNPQLANAILRAFEKQTMNLAQAYGARMPEKRSGSPASMPASPVGEMPDSRNSPLQGVSNSDWQSFVQAMKTDDIGFSSDKHIGAWHQNRERLKQLNLTEPSNEEEQYQAFVKDCQDYYEKNKDLMAEFMAEPIQVGTDTHYISASGILALLKAAGPKNATHWIRHPEERSRFPKTTELFLRCNNCF